MVGPPDCNEGRGVSCSIFLSGLSILSIIGVSLCSSRSLSTRNSHRVAASSPPFPFTPSCSPLYPFSRPANTNFYDLYGVATPPVLRRSKPRNMRKFADQAWHGVTHVAMFGFELYLVGRPAVNWLWWNDILGYVYEYCRCCRCCARCRCCVPCAVCSVNDILGYVYEYCRCCRCCVRCRCCVLCAVCCVQCAVCCVQCAACCVLIYPSMLQ